MRLGHRRVYVSSWIPANGLRKKKRLYYKQPERKAAMGIFHFFLTRIRLCLSLKERKPVNTKGIHALVDVSTIVLK